jgi:hypothetical protein
MSLRVEFLKTEKSRNLKGQTLNRKFENRTAEIEW